MRLSILCLYSGLSVCWYIRMSILYYPLRLCASLRYTTNPLSIVNWKAAKFVKQI